jgi:hypothetical protein
MRDGYERGGCEHSLGYFIIFCALCLLCLFIQYGPSNARAGHIYQPKRIVTLERAAIVKMPIFRR